MIASTSTFLKKKKKKGEKRETEIKERSNQLGV